MQDCCSRDRWSLREATACKAVTVDRSMVNARVEIGSTLAHDGRRRSRQTLTGTFGRSSKMAVIPEVASQRGEGQQECTLKVVCCSRRHQGRCRWKALPREIHARCSRPTRRPRDRGGSCWTYATDVFNSPRHPPATEPPLPLRVPPTLPEYADTSLLLAAKPLLTTSGF